MFDAHQEAYQPDGFLSAERRQFERPRFGRGQGGGIVLRTPDGPFAVDNDLGIQDAFDAFFHGFSGGFNQGGIHRFKSFFPVGYIIQDIEAVGHGVVVVGDMAVIPFSQGVKLRPSAVGGVLSFQNVADAFFHGFQVGGVACFSVGFHEVIDLTAGRIVVVGRVRPEGVGENFRGRTFRQGFVVVDPDFLVFGGIIRLRPPPDGPLVDQHAFGHRINGTLLT